MEEQKNLNNSSAHQSAAAIAQKNIPTAAGALIILIVAVMAGVGMLYFFQADFSGNFYGNNAVISGKSLKAETEMPSTQESAAAFQDPAEEAVAQPEEGADFDFDYELKKLDEQNNSVSSDDFNENEMSDANVGL